MEHANPDLINRFFDAYGRRDWAALQAVTAEDMKWTFPGDHPLGGVKTGLSEVITFFDKVGAIMGASSPQVEKLVVGVNGNYLIEGQQIRTNRRDGVNLDQTMCVLWMFEGGKIKEGRHLASDEAQLNAFYRHTCK